MNQPVVLITGALTGIGCAAAVAFARERNRIIISGRRKEAGQALAAEPRTLGAEAEFLRADVCFEAEVRNVVEQTVETVERFGRIDVAVNNAGTEDQWAPIVEQPSASYEDTFAVNVLGTLLSIRHAMRAMLAQGSGSIINLPSVAGPVGTAGASLYVASKHAVEGPTKSAALEGAAAGVRVNAVAPGPAATGMPGRFVGGREEGKAGFLATITARRAATPEEIAQTVVFPASDKARYSPDSPLQ